ncbi:MAG: hypothetical protein NUV72_00830 [Bauldia sp.]|nr:hypothetical protein [Bauldia sp.]
MDDRVQRRIEQFRLRIVEELDNLGDLIEAVSDDSRPVQLDQQSAGGRRGMARFERRPGAQYER